MTRIGRPHFTVSDCSAASIDPSTSRAPQVAHKAILPLRTAAVRARPWPLPPITSRSADSVPVERSKQSQFIRIPINFRVRCISAETSAAHAHLRYKTPRAISSTHSNSTCIPATGRYTQPASINHQTNEVTTTRPDAKRRFPSGGARCRGFVSFPATKRLDVLGQMKYREKSRPWIQSSATFASAASTGRRVKTTGVGEVKIEECDPAEVGWIAT